MRGWWNQEYNDLPFPVPDRLDNVWFKAPAKKPRGHFSQISSDRPTRVGCAYHFCDDIGDYFVCQYDAMWV